MGSLKRITGFVLAVMVVFQLALLQATAATTLAGVDGNIVRFNIAAESVEGSDFVKVFPEMLYLGEGAVENPLIQKVDMAPALYDSIPNYFQEAYPDALYGGGTVASCGSGITALSMVATYLTGYSYYPDMLSRWFAGKAEDDIARLTYAAKALGLSFEVSQDWEVTYGQLQAGKCAVIQTDTTSVFSEHFVVLKGMTEDGKILVNDPCEANLSNEELREKYTAGFEETEISTGFCCAWIFEQAVVPEATAPYTDAPASEGTSRYASLELTPSEKQLLAKLVCANTYYECEEGQQMLVEVILNRLLSKDYTGELKEIVCGDDPLCDISKLNAAAPEQSHYLVVERAVFGPYLLETDVTDFSYTCHK